MRRNGLLLGWEAGETRVFGFRNPSTGSPGGELITYDGDAPVCIIAPTGSGKGRDFLIPNLLTYPGPILALDPKGELSAVCTRARRALGQRVAILDPFGVTGRPGDRLNPFDLLTLPGAQLECDAEMLAAQLGEGHAVEKDPFWSDSASGLIAGLIAHIATAGERRDFTALRGLLYDDDLDFRLATILDKEEGLPRFVRDEFVGFLSAPSDKTRPSILSTALTYIKALGSTPVARCLEDSTIALTDVVDGAPLDVFITVPPEKLKSHRALIRLWTVTLLTAVMRREAIPEQKTLLVLDEAAQFGPFDPLLTAATLLRGYGLQLVTAWQDLGQLRSRYPQDWTTILNNSAVILSFGHAHYAACKEYGELLGVEAVEVLRLDDDRALLAVRGEGVKQIRRLNYLRDTMFAVLADPNPYFERRGPATGGGRGRAP